MVGQNAQTAQAQTQAQADAFEALGAVLDAQAADQARLEELRFPFDGPAAAEYAILLEREAQRRDPGDGERPPGELLAAWQALYRAYAWLPPSWVVQAASDRFLSRLGYVPVAGTEASR